MRLSNKQLREARLLLQPIIVLLASTKRDGKDIAFMFTIKLKNSIADWKTFK